MQRCDFLHRWFKRGIPLLLIVTALSLFLFGCSQVLSNNEKEKILAVGEDMSPADEPLKNGSIMNEIHGKLLEGYEQVDFEDVNNRVSYNLIIPEYLPERFEYYGIYMRENPGIPTNQMVKQLWYDPEESEILMVTQSKTSAPDQEGYILFTDGLEVPGKISDIFPWAKYRCQYEFTKNGISVQGYMLVNDESSRNEYERILKSLSR